MHDVSRRLFDMTGMTSRQAGGWPGEFVWLHNIADILIGLALVVIPSAFIYLSLYKRELPFRRVCWLFGASLFSSGLVHLLEVVTYHSPLFWPYELLKLVTALLWWGTVAAMVPVLPKALNLLWQTEATSHTTVKLLRPVERGKAVRYGVAVAAAGLATIARMLLDPLLSDSYPFLIALLCVVLVSWRDGMGPALLCLILSGLAACTFFVSPRNSLLITNLHDQVGLGLYCFVGMAVALLGELQRDAWLRANAGLQALSGQQRLLEEEIERRKRVEKQLRQSEVRFRTLAEAMPQMVWTSRADGYRDYCNQRWSQYTGIPLPECLGKGWEQALHPEDRAGAIAKFQDAVQTGSLYEVECRLRRYDGVYRWFLARARPQDEEVGPLTQWFGTYTDIDDQKATENELRLSEERFRVLSEEIPQMVWRASPQGDVVYYNRRWYDYTGLSFQETRGQGWQQVIHPDDLVLGVQHWQDALRRGDRHEVEQRLRRKDGHYRWHLVRGRPLRNSREEIEQWVGTITDIHEQRQQAEALEEQVQRRTAELTTANLQLQTEVEERRRAEHLANAFAVELQRSNHELEQFASVASHDLQEPLRKIQAFADRLKARCGNQLGEQGLDYLQRILNSAVRMRRLIDELLAYARVTTRGQPFVPVDLGNMAREVVSDLEARLQQSGGFVEIAELPLIEADPVQMRQLFQNLIGNSLKFRKPGEPALVRVAGRVLSGSPDLCELTVSDNGIGFEQEYAERIFQLFERLHGRSDYEGTGMGLAICRKIVERHGGRILAHGTPGQGATFLVRLPLRHRLQGAFNLAEPQTSDQMSHVRTG